MAALAVARIELAPRVGAEFNPSDGNGYTHLHTDTGVMLVTVTGVVRQGTGSKLSMLIANPLSADFRNPEATFVYGNARGDQGLQEWQSTLKTKDLVLNTTLARGSWTRVSVNLPDVSPEEMGYVHMSLRPKEIRLTAPSDT